MAKSFNLTAKINAQLGNIRPVVQSLKRQLSGIKANVNINVSANAARNIGQLNRALSILNQNLAQTTTIARSAAQSLTALGQAAGSTNFANLARQASQINRALNNCQRNAQGATNQMEEFGRVSGLAIRRFSGFTIATGIVFGFVNALGSAIKEAIEFDTELIKIGQATGTTKEGVKGLAAEITRLSTGFGVSSKALADVSLTLAQAGLNARDTKVALEALAKSSLAPTFTDIKNTVEGSISAIAQFEIGVDDLADVLGSVNAVSAKFAVESDDIIAAVRRTGGVFAAASKGVSEGKDALNEFIAVFTSIRATTRESAETIATGLRTIFTRFQRSDTVKNLQELGIELTDAEGKFVGAYKAVDALAKGLRELDPRDLRFSQIVEELGGFRQVSKVIPLISQTEKRLLALKTAQEGKNSLDKDAAAAQEALANKIAKVREEFIALVREITETSTFKTLVDLTLSLTKGLIDLARTVKPLIPLLAVLGGIKLAGIATNFGTGFVRGLSGRAGRNDGGYAPKFHGGGLVPGGKGTKDDYPATLQTGEYVIRQKAVDAIGVENLDRMNRQGYAAGGIVKQNTVGAAILDSKIGSGSGGTITVTPEQSPFLSEDKVYQYERGSISSPAKENIRKKIRKDILKSVKFGTQAITGQSMKVGQNDALLKTIGLGSIEGSIFEGILKNVDFSGNFNKPEDPKRPFDFVDGFQKNLTDIFPSISSSTKYIDAKNNDKNAQIAEIRKKIIGQIREDFTNGVSSRDGEKVASVNAKDARLEGMKKRSAEIAAAVQSGEKPKTKEQELAEKRAAKAAARIARLGRNKGGEVPAILTRGEYVLQKSAADKLGKDTLDKLNHADKYHTGGLVGFARGGLTGPSAGTQSAVQGALDAGISVSELQNTFRRLEIVFGSGTRELDRAIRASANAFTEGKNATEAFTDGVEKGNRARAAAERGRGGGYNPFTSSGRSSIIRNSPLLNGGLGRGVRERIGGLRDNPLNLAIGLGLGASSISSQFDKEGTNAAIQGLTGAIGGAGAGFAAGGIPGAILGGGVGAISSAQQARIQKTLIDSDKELVKSTRELEKAFKELATGGSIDKITEAFDNINSQNVNRTGALRQQATGSILSSFRGSSSDVGLAPGLAIFAALESASVNGAAGRLFGGSNDAFNASTRRTKAGIFDELATANQPNFNSSNQFVDRELNAGKSVQEILKISVGQSAVRTLALSSTNATEADKARVVDSLGRLKNLRDNGATEEQIKEEENTLNSLSANIVAPELESRKAELALRRSLNIAIGYNTKELDRFFKRMNGLAATFGRVNDAVTESQAALDNFAAGGRDIRTGRSQNTFANTEAFSQQEIIASAVALNKALGNNAASRELTNNAVGATQGKDIIAQVIAEASGKAKLGEDVSGFIISELNSRLKAAGLNETVIRGIAGPGGEISNAINSRKDSNNILDEEFFATANLETLGAQNLDKILKTTADAFTAVNGLLDQFESGINTSIKLRLTENKAIANASKIRQSGALQVRELRNENISIKDAIQPFEDSIAKLTNGKTNPADIFKNINTLQAQRDSLTNSATSARASGDTTSAARFLEQAGSLEVAIQENREALETLSGDTTVLSEVQKKLADLESKRQQAEKTLQDLAFGGKDDRREFNRRAGLANQLIGGRKLDGPDLQVALQTIAELGQVLEASGIIDDKRKKQIDEFGNKQLLGNDFIKGIFGDVDPGLKKIGALITGKGGEKDSLIGIAEKAIIRQADAADMLAKLQVDTNKYIIELNKQLKANTQILQEGLLRNGPPIPLQTKNAGGFIPGGGPNKDTVPAMLTTGEYVVNRDSARQNAALLEAINSGQVIGYNDGGRVRAINNAIARKRRLGKSTVELEAQLRPGGPEALAKSKEAQRQAFEKDREKRKEAFQTRQDNYKKGLREARETRRNTLKGLYAQNQKRALTNLVNINSVRNYAAIDARNNNNDNIDLIPKSARAVYFNEIKRHRAKSKNLAIIGSTHLKKAGVRRTGFNKGGRVGGGIGGSSVDMTAFGQYAQVFASSAAQFERAANILSQISIPTRIEMTGSHTVQVLLNGGDVLARMDEPIRNLVLSEINKAMNRHVNPVTGETSGDFNG